MFLIKHYLCIPPFIKIPTINVFIINFISINGISSFYILSLIHVKFLLVTTSNPIVYIKRSINYSSFLVRECWDGWLLISLCSNHTLIRSIHIEYLLTCAKRMEHIIKWGGVAHKYSLFIYYYYDLNTC